jgi:hypothetical protein
MRFGFAEPAVADAGFHALIGEPELVSTSESIGLLLLPAVPANISFAVVVADPVAGKVAPSYASYFGAAERAVEKVSRKTLRAVLLFP